MMKPAARSARPVQVVAAMVAAAVPAVALAQDDAAPVSLEPSVRSVVASMGATPPRAPVKRMKFAMEVASSSAPAVEVESRYLYLGDGLWGILSTIKRPNFAGAQQAVSVCGMFDGVAATSTTTTIETTQSLPIGKLFVPFGMRTGIANDAVAKLTNLSIDGASPCSPSPGSAFDFQTRTETQLKTSAGLFASGKVLTATIKGRCESSSAVPASGLHKDLRGEAVEVTCNGANDAGKPLVRKYAYLVHSGIYVLLETATESNRFKYRVLEAEYEP